MAFPVLAGEARHYYHAKLVRRRILVVCAALAFVGFLGLEVKSYVAKSKGRATPAQALAAVPPKSFAAKQVADVNMLASAVSQFTLANGALPTSLYTTSDGRVVLCGSFCDAALYSIGGFGAYQAGGIHLVNYTPGLIVADANTIDLVPGAKCDTSGKALGGTTSTKNAMAILYAASTGTGTESRCIVL